MFGLTAGAGASTPRSGRETGRLRPVGVGSAPRGQRASVRAARPTGAPFCTWERATTSSPTSKQHGPIDGPMTARVRQDRSRDLLPPRQRARHADRRAAPASVRHARPTRADSSRSRIGDTVGEPLHQQEAGLTRDQDVGAGRERTGRGVLVHNQHVLAVDLRCGDQSFGREAKRRRQPRPILGTASSRIAHRGAKVQAGVRANAHAASARGHAMRDSGARERREVVSGKRGAGMESRTSALLAPSLVAQERRHVDLGLVVVKRRGIVPEAAAGARTQRLRIVGRLARAAEVDGPLPNPRR